MILASRKPNGKVQYYDANTGMPYTPGRETGRHLGRIPDPVFRFLLPKIPAYSGLGNSKASRPATVTTTDNRKPFDAKKHTLWYRFIMWLKNLFGNGRQ